MAAQLMATNGFSGARAVAMDGARHQFLAGAALAADQNGGIALGYLADEGLHLAHAPALADDDAFKIQLRLQSAIFVAQRFRGENVVQRDRGDSGNRAQEVHMVVLKAVLLFRRRSSTTRR